MTDVGGVPQDNPFNNLVYSYGHRNPQGIDWDRSTEHGRSDIQSGLDEVNNIEKGKNYGWPLVQGDEQKTGMKAPLIHSGSDIWAPAGAVFLRIPLFLGA